MGALGNLNELFTVSPYYAKTYPHTDRDKPQLPKEQLIIPLCVTWGNKVLYVYSDVDRQNGLAPGSQVEVSGEGKGSLQDAKVDFPPSIPNSYITEQSSGCWVLG